MHNFPWKKLMVDVFNKGMFEIYVNNCFGAFCPNKKYQYVYSSFLLYVEFIAIKSNPAGLVIF